MRRTRPLSRLQCARIPDVTLRGGRFEARHGTPRSVARLRLQATPQPPSAGEVRPESRRRHRPTALDRGVSPPRLPADAWPIRHSIAPLRRPVSIAGPSCARMRSTVNVSSVARLRVSVMMQSRSTCVPNKREATSATRASRSSRVPSVAMVAEVPTHWIGVPWPSRRSRTRRISMATSAPCEDDEIQVRTIPDDCLVELVLPRHQELEHHEIRQ